VYLHPNLHICACETHLHAFLRHSHFCLGSEGYLKRFVVLNVQVKMEQDEISEEREFPKIRRLSDQYRGPSDDSTEVCGPVSAHLTDTFHGTGAHEKQTHPRKRARQESPERPAADSGGAWGQIKGGPIPN
jgi:hypothetical protein